MAFRIEVVGILNVITPDKMTRDVGKLGQTTVPVWDEWRWLPTRLESRGLEHCDQRTLWTVDSRWKYLPIDR